MLPPPPMLIDVRQPDAFLKDPTPGATNIPFRQLTAKLLLVNRRAKLEFVADDISDARLAESYAMSIGFVNTTARAIK